MYKKKIITPLTEEEREEKAKNIYANVSTRLAEARKKEENGFSQQNLSEYLGTTNTRICKIEKGKANPSFADIKILADFLGVSLDWLCSNDEETAPTEEDNKTPWRDIPPILALIQTLEHFEPLIEYGTTDEEPFVKLSFFESGFFANREHLKLFFEDYRPVERLIKSGDSCAEAIDLLSSHLSQKYKNLI